MESPLMLNPMRERMPGANVPLPYGGWVTGSNSLAYEGNDCAGRGAHAILSAPAPIKNLRLETPLDVTVLIDICRYLTEWLKLIAGYLCLGWSLRGEGSRPYVCRLRSPSYFETARAALSITSATSFGCET